MKTIGSHRSKQNYFVSIFPSSGFYKGTRGGKVLFENELTRKTHKKEREGERKKKGKQGRRMPP